MPSIGIAGAGLMAGEHLASYRAMDDVEVAAVAARRSATDFVAEHDLDADTYTDVETLCREADIDALDVCTPTVAHPDHVTTGLDAGLDVFCEKPLARHLQEATALADHASDAEGVLMVGHVLRFFPEYETAREQIQDGAIGDPGVARARRLSPFPDWGSDDWFADEEKSGGVFLDLAIHDLDYLRWVWGEVDRVFARRRTDTHAQHGIVTLHFENGAVGYVEASWAQPGSRGLTWEFELAGDEGVLAFDEEETLAYRAFDEEEMTVERPLAEDAFYRELRAFVDCVEDGGDPPVDAETAIEAMRLSLAAKRSAEDGRPVDPAEVTA